MPRFSANLGYLWKELPLPEAVLAARKAGFEAVEFHEPYHYPAEEIREVLEETGLKMLGLNTRRGIPGTKDRDLAAVPGRETDARNII
ncbi:MAG: isomerase, partial [bacterium]